MRRALFATVAVATIASLGAACDDTSGAGGATSSGSTTSSSASSGSTSTGNTQMCIQPDDVGNDLGIGHYCTPGGGECKAFPLAALCLADVGQDEHFCTRIGCDATTNCGMGAGCLIDPQGSACVPCKCDSAGVGCTMTSSSSSSSASAGSTGTGN